MQILTIEKNLQGFDIREGINCEEWPEFTQKWQKIKFHLKKYEPGYDEPVNIGVYPFGRH